MNDWLAFATTRITTKLTQPLAARVSHRDRLVLAAVVGMIVLLSIAGALTRWRAQPVEQPLAPIIIIATARPARPAATAAAIPVAAPAAPVRYVVAFAAPNGAVLGAIPEPNGSAIEARYGAEWVMVKHEGNDVWVRVADLLGAGNLADLAPAPTAEIRVVSVPQSAPQVTQYEQPPEPTAEPWHPPMAAPDQWHAPLALPDTTPPCGPNWHPPMACDAPAAQTVR